MSKQLLTILSILFFILQPYRSPAADIPLHIAITIDSPNAHKYFHEVLQLSLEEAGHTPNFTISELPQARIQSYMNSGRLSIDWMLESKERNEKYIPIKVGLTNGLIGNRVLFIKKGEQHLYDGVKNLDDFRELNLVGAVGSKWFDARVWQANNIEYKEHTGNWKSIFKMIPSRPDYNYFSRGVNEILEESKQYPKLAIEKNLLFVYTRDYFFYLSKTGANAGANYKDIIEDSLEQARDSGLIERLTKKYWGDHLKQLQCDKRIQIPLITPM